MIVINEITEEILDKISSELLKIGNCFVDVTTNTPKKLEKKSKNPFLKNHIYKVRLIAFIAEGTKYTLHANSKELNCLNMDILN